MPLTSRFPVSSRPGCRQEIAPRVVIATAIVLVLGFSPQPAAAGEQALQLAVQVNGYSTDKIGEFVLRDGSLLARRAELGDLGFPRTRNGELSRLSDPTT